MKWIKKLVMCSLIFTLFDQFFEYLRSSIIREIAFFFIVCPPFQKGNSNFENFKKGKPRKAFGWGRAEEGGHFQKERPFQVEFRDRERQNCGLLQSN